MSAGMAVYYVRNLTLSPCTASTPSEREGASRRMCGANRCGHRGAYLIDSSHRCGYGATQILHADMHTWATATYVW